MKKEESDLRDRTEAFALQIIRLFGVLPRSTEAQVLGKQFPRSGTSVGANYPEAYRARSKGDFIAICGDSSEELEETAYWLELLADGGIVQAVRIAALAQECNELRHFRHDYQELQGNRALTSVLNSSFLLLPWIDALDEAGEVGRNPLVEMLARNAQRLPDWLGLVVTSRPEFDVKTPLQVLSPFLLLKRHCQRSGWSFQAIDLPNNTHTLQHGAQEVTTTLDPN